MKSRPIRALWCRRWMAAATCAALATVAAGCAATRLPYDRGAAAARVASPAPSATRSALRAPSDAANASASATTAPAALPVTVGRAASMTAPRNYLPAVHFTDAAFATSTDGWASGVVGLGCSGAGSTATAQGGVIESTVDGGTTWTVQYRGPDAVLMLTFANRLDGWALAVPADRIPACGPPPWPGQLEHQVLLATKDAGRRWTVVSAHAAGIDALYFTGANQGFAGRTGCRVGASGASDVPGVCGGALLRTLDGGRSWLPITAADPIVARATAPGVPPGSSNVSLPVVALARGGGALWALEAGSPRSVGPGRRSGIARVVRSTNGGLSWSLAGTLPLPNRASTAGAVGTLTFVSPRKGWASIYVPGTCGMADCSVNAVFRTADGGRNWIAVTAGQPECNVAAPAFAASETETIVARGVNLAACAGPATTLMRSTNGGATWSQATTWSVEYPLHLLVVPGRGAGLWAVTGSALLRSVDGGVVWSQELPAPVPTEAVDFLTSENGWGVGTVSHPGAVLRTTNGGRTWSLAASFRNVHLFGISFAGARHGWVSGSTPAWDPQSGTGVLLHTSDRGRTWAGVVPSSGVGIARASSKMPTRRGTLGPGGGAPTPMSGIPNTAAIRFSSARSGTLIGLGALSACYSGCPPADLFRTGDGGTRWSSAGTVPNPGGLFAVDIGAAGRVWGMWRGPANCGPLLREHSAAPSGWRVLGCLSGLSFVGNPALAFPTAQSGFAILPQVLSPAVPGQRPAVIRPMLLRTADGGRSWTADPLPLAPGAWFGSHLFFLNPTHGWLLSGGAVWVTTDGGRDWTGAAP